MRKYTSTLTALVHVAHSQWQVSLPDSDAAAAAAACMHACMHTHKVHSRGQMPASHLQVTMRDFPRSQLGPWNPQGTCSCAPHLDLGILICFLGILICFASHYGQAFTQIQSGQRQASFSVSCHPSAIQVTIHSTFPFQYLFSEYFCHLSILAGVLLGVTPTQLDPNTESSMHMV